CTMGPKTLGSGRPTHDEAIFRTARRAFELGELHLASRRLNAPRWRIHALLALISAAKTSGLATRPMEAELRVDLDRLLASRHGRVPNMVQSVVREQLAMALDREPGCPSGDWLQDLVACLSGPLHLTALHVARSLLAVGEVERARALADAWDEPAIRHRLRHLTATGLWGRGRDRRFVGRPFDDELPASLPRFVAMMRKARHGAPLTERQWSHAEALLSRLSANERQAALAHTSAAAYHAGGYAAGVCQVQAIRYQSSRQLAWLHLLVASLAGGRLDDAWRALGALRVGAFRERGRLLLARELIRRGARRRALRLLGEPVMASRREERTLLWFEIDGRAVSRRRSMARCDEDLSLFDRALPSLAHRRTIAASRVVFEALDSDAVDFEEMRYAGLRAFALPRRGLRRLVGDRTARRCWLQELGGDARRLRALLRGVRAVVPGAEEPLWSELLSVRAARLGHTATERLRRRHAEALARGLGDRRGLPVEGLPALIETDAGSAERCLEVEGISWSPRARTRRRVIVGATKYCLERWLVDGVEPPPGALSSRLRTLSNLGGRLASEHLARVLESVHRPNAAFLPAVAVLAALDPRRAARLIFFQHFDVLLHQPRRAGEILSTLEDHGALDAGFGPAWERLVRAVRDCLGDRRGNRWLRQWMAAWPGRQVPTLGGLDCSSAELADGLPATGEQLIARCRRRLQAVMSLPFEQFPKALDDDPAAIRLVRWLRPDIVPRFGRRIDESAWRLDLRSLARDGGEVDPSIVRRLARALPAKERRGSVFRRLMAGRHPVADTSRLVEMPLRPEAAGPEAAGPEAAGPEAAAHRLVYLDKRRDVFTLLRFADCVPCCFHRSNRRYRMDEMRPWILALWKDPLSFCFHVERHDPKEGWSPRGFVFGAFSLGAEGPAVLLNGLYLRRQDRDLRRSILQAIEETFCRPLGIRRIGIANVFGGRGALPADYVRRPSTIFRLRALRSGSGPASDVYDDISRMVNRTEYLDHLYWRRLAPPVR
ncbi:MAG: hypothetical protein AAGE94_04320, partial [Acidobacteriota bacterium]